MPEMVTTCGKCNTNIIWQSSEFDDVNVPDCPNCGYNQFSQFWEASISDLIEMLKDPEMRVCSNATTELGKRGDQSAVEPLIDALNNEDTKLGSVVALGKIPDERAVDPLVSILKEGSGVSSCAAEALIAIGTQRAIQAVVDNIDDIDIDSYQQVFKSFQDRGESIIPTFIPLLDHSNRGVKKHVAEVLNTLGWQPEKPIDQLEFSVQAGDWDKLKEGGERSLNFLQITFLGKSSRLSKKDVLKGLEFFGWEPESEEEIINVLIANGEVDKLIETGEASVSHLINALHEDVTQWTTIEALGKIGDSRAVEPLIDLLGDCGSRTGGYVMEALGEIKDDRAIEPLMARFKNGDENSGNAARAIKNITGKRPDEKQGCFIATACYGSADCREVEILQSFRDNCLVKFSIGRGFVWVYYRLSPSFANFLCQQPKLKRFVRRGFVSPVVNVVSFLGESRKL